MSQPCWVEVDWNWGWLKLRLIEVKVDWSWGWLKLRLIKVEVEWSWGWMKLSKLGWKLEVYFVLAVKGRLSFKYGFVWTYCWSIIKMKTMSGFLEALSKSKKKLKLEEGWFNNPIFFFEFEETGKIGLRGDLKKTRKYNKLGLICSSSYLPPCWI